MREMSLARIDGKIYLFPVPVFKEKKYLILCSSETEAEFITLAIKEKRMTHPDLISEDFLFITYHTDKKTKIFAPSSKRTV